MLALRVLTDDGEVDVVVTSGEARERLAKNDRRVDVKLLAHGDVPRDVASLGDWREEDTWMQEWLLVRHSGCKVGEEAHP